MYRVCRSFLGAGDCGPVRCYASTAGEVPGAIMSHVPAFAMMVLPFKPLWLSARAGHPAVGDPAPDFALPVLHSDHVMRLSEEIRKKPVVLIFGSYT